MIITDNYKVNRANALIADDDKKFKLVFDGTHYELTHGRSVIWTYSRDLTYIELYLRGFIDGMEEALYRVRDLLMEEDEDMSNGECLDAALSFIDDTLTERWEIIAPTHVLYDGMGEMFRGSKEECFNEVVLWANDEVSEGAYSDEEREDIALVFSLESSRDWDRFSYMGFHIKPIEEDG